tara:strand:- start:741 stop:1163 length:423 start_codon:yes stop_codon:yes gene_type:complete
MYYIGTSPSEVLNGFIKRYFYGLRRNDDGELFLIRVDQLQGGAGAALVINDLGDSIENFPDFEEGIDFLEGIDADHNVQYDNLRYQQMKWEGRALLYYIEPETGHFVQRISEAYTYPENESSPAYGEGIDEQVVPAGPGY